MVFRLTFTRLHTKFRADMNDRELRDSLVDRIFARAAQPNRDYKKELWAWHNALPTTANIPVCVTVEGIPGPEWRFMRGGNPLRCQTPLARTFEMYLRTRIWAAENIPDDHVLWPAVAVDAGCAFAADWGTPLDWERPRGPLSAGVYRAPFVKGIHCSRLRPARIEVDVSGRYPMIPIYHPVNEHPELLTIWAETAPAMAESA